MPRHNLELNLRELRYLKNWVLGVPSGTYYNSSMESKLKIKIIKMIEEKVKLAKDMRYLQRKESFRAIHEKPKVNAKITKWIPRGTFYDGTNTRVDGGVSGK